MLFSALKNWKSVPTPDSVQRKQPHTSQFTRPVEGVFISLRRDGFDMMPGAPNRNNVWMAIRIAHDFVSGVETKLSQSILL